MSRISTIALHGESEKIYHFDVHGRDHKHENVGGIYAVTKRYEDSEGTQSHTVLYIGQAPNLSIEFDNHPKTGCFDEHGGNCVCTLAEKNEEVRMAAEEDLTKYYRPICND
jgi:hypothetical protein